MSNIAGEKCVACGSESHWPYPCDNPRILVLLEANERLEAQLARIVACINRVEDPKIERGAAIQF